MSGQVLLPLIVTDPKSGERKTWEHYYIDSKTGVIYFSRRFNGKRIKFSTHFAIDEASKAKAFANREFERRIGKRKAFQKTLISDELTSWIKVVEAENLHKSTMYNYYQAEKDIRKYWGDSYPEEITRDALPDFYIWFKKERGISIENTLKIFKIFCRYLHQKVVDGKPLLPAIPTIKDPDKKKREIKRAEKKERVFTPEEFKKVYESALNIREAAIVLFMYTMASRIDETLKLEFDRTIYLDEEVPCYRWRKGQNKMSLEGVHALPDHLVKVLRQVEALSEAEETKLLFPQQKNKQKAISSQQIDLKAWRERADIGWHWTFHTFRHTCLTNLFNDESLNQLMVCKLYRVSLKVATKTYVKVQLSSILKLKNAVKVKL